MNIRALMLGTATTLLLAGSAMAAPTDFYNTNPTPEERARTNDLNARAADDARGDADDNARAQADYNAARNNYDRRLDNYRADRAAYERDLARYNNDRYAYAHRWDAFYGYSRFREVLNVGERDLLGARVSTRGGRDIGRIRDVDTDRFGRVTRVSVATAPGRRAWIDAMNLRYDPSSRVVLTDLSASEVDDMARMRYPRF